MSRDTVFWDVILLGLIEESSILEDHSASTFRVKELAKLGFLLALCLAYCSTFKKAEFQNIGYLLPD
jgi:hypothetical protein